MVAENRGDKVILVVFMRVGGVFLFLVFFIFVLVVTLVDFELLVLSLLWYCFLSL